MELVGVQFMDFEGRSGERVTGVKLHCLDDEIGEGKGFGRKVFSVFCSSDKCPKVPAIGSILLFYWNRFGRLDHFEVIS